MSDFSFWMAVLLFVATYGVIAFARIPYLQLDRPGAAVAGAVLMVACGVLSFDEAWQAIDARTIVLLLGMMILNVLLEDSGFFDLATRVVLHRTRSPLHLLAGLSILSGVLSALFLNDTVCLMLTLPVLSLLRRGKWPTAPFLVALAMSANIGSVMTVIGNPQNMLIANYSGWTYLQFALAMVPVGLAGLAALIVILAWFYAPQLRAVAHSAGAPAAAGASSAIEQPAELPLDRGLLVKTLVVLAGVLLGFVVIGDLPLVAMTGAVVLLLIAGRHPTGILARVDWVLLAFFAGLFIVVRGLEATGLVAKLAEAVRPLYGQTLGQQLAVFSVVTVVASNVVSNVPFVVLAREVVPTLLEPNLMWLVLSMASTFAGNLTIPGSVATLIVLETARRGPAPREARIGYYEFLRVGIPVTLITTVLGAVILAAEHWLLRTFF